MQVIQGERGGLIKAWIDGVPLEDSARVQLNNMAAMPFVHKHVAVMPDVHWGMGATIGSVIPTKGAIIPASVGVDLGCVDSETEVLTPSGWIKIPDWSGQDILIYDRETDTSRFE